MRKSPSFKEALGELIELPDPLFESVAAYHEGRLQGDEKVAFEARLKRDEAARDLLDELRAFAPVDEETDEPASEFEVASTMRTVRRRLEGGADDTASSGSGGQVAPSTWRLAVAALALLCFGLAWAWQDTRRQLESLRIGAGAGVSAAQIHHLVGAGELRGGEAGSVPVLEAGPARHVLVITPTEAPDAGHRLSGALFHGLPSSSEPMLTFDAVTGEHGVIVLSLDVALQAGEYELRLTDAASGDAVESFRFQWASESP